MIGIIFTTLNLQEAIGARVINHLKSRVFAHCCLAGGGLFAAIATNGVTTFFVLIFFFFRKM